ncbi:MAG: purine-cytosine permease family protein [Acidimicrobiales bacterium]
MATTSDPSAFVTVRGDRHAEAPRTLAEPVPQVLSTWDQLGLWGNLGVSLLGFTGAIFVLQPLGAGTPELSLEAALTAIVLGTVLGTAVVAGAGLAGARTGAPAMVLLRGLFGTRLSYGPTALNVLQLLGWGIFEVVTISTAAHTVAPAVPRPAFVVGAGVVTGVLAVRPLGAIRVLRRYVTAAVVVVLVYLLAELLAHPLPALGHGTWTGFWPATDTVVGAAVSFAPLAADYTRHSRSGAAAVTGAMVGYSITQIACYALGLVALVTVARTPHAIYGAFVAVPAGAVAFGVLAARELDQSFADVYSTAVSVQNLRPRWDRRLLAVGVAAVATVCALWVDIAAYETFLTLLGSVFVPLFAVFLVDFFGGRHRRDLSTASATRWAMLAPWAAGFVVYQLINPGYVSWWAHGWATVDSALGFHPAGWMSASIGSFVVAAALTAVGLAARRGWRTVHRRGGRPSVPAAG